MFNIRNCCKLKSIPGKKQQTKTVLVNSFIYMVLYSIILPLYKHMRK